MRERENSVFFNTEHQKLFETSKMVQKNLFFGVLQLNLDLQNFISVK